MPEIAEKWEELMAIRRRTVLAGGGAAIAAATAARARAAKSDMPEMSLAGAIVDDGQKIKIVHVFAENGQTRIADAALPADTSPYPLFKQFLTHKASATAVYGAPPHHQGLSKAADKYLLFIAAGETVLTAGKDRRRCGAGTFILAEGGAGYGERADADGYTAIKVRLAD
jgi:hypothetical protein